MVSRRKKSLLQFVANMRHGPEGLVQAWRDESSFRAEILLLLPIIVSMAWRQCSVDNWFRVMGLCAIVLIAELLNTSRENDLRARYPTEQELLESDPGKHRLVKASYDTAAGAVTVALVLVLPFFIYAMVRPR